VLGPCARDGAGPLARPFFFFSAAMDGGATSHGWAEGSARAGSAPPRQDGGIGLVAGDPRRIALCGSREDGL